MDDALNLALCRVSALTPEQIAGLEALAVMTEDELAAFADRVDAAWNANRQGIVDAQDELKTAVHRQAEIELECVHAARTRNPVRPVLNGDEINRVTAARHASDRARASIDSARARFKQGVTADQLEAG